MFTLKQIATAHAKVMTGADFPRYAYDLVQLGVIRFETFVHDGHTEYTGADNTWLTSVDLYPEKHIAERSDVDGFEECLRLHQKGGSDFMTFCMDAANNGVEKWTVDLEKMTCTYYSKAADKMIVELIPRIN